MYGRAQALGGESPPTVVGGDLKAFPPAPSSPFSIERIQTSARVSGTSSLISAIITQIISPGMPFSGGPLKGWSAN